MTPVARFQCETLLDAALDFAMPFVRACDGVLTFGQTMGEGGRYALAEVANQERLPEREQVVAVTRALVAAVPPTIG